MPNANAARRIRDRQRIDRQAARAAIVAERTTAIDRMHREMHARLRSAPVHTAITDLWMLREQVRELRARWLALGGRQLSAQLARLWTYAHESDEKHERPWLLRELVDLWDDPPREIIQDSYVYDIVIKVRSLKLKTKGSNPYEWKRADVMSFDPEHAGHLDRARILTKGETTNDQWKSWYTAQIESMDRRRKAITRLETRVARMLTRMQAHAAQAERKHIDAPIQPPAPKVYVFKQVDGAVFMYERSTYRLDSAPTVDVYGYGDYVGHYPSIEVAVKIWKLKPIQIKELGT